nr:retrovirus-related Pol polyprotein from transposon TNT 1-94 [Tanacetum cinerariifolium]
MSSAEAEYMALSTSCAQHFRTKQIHTRYHFIKEQVENGIIEIYFVRTEYQLADMFTKALPEDRFKYLVRHIGDIGKSLEIPTDLYHTHIVTQPSSSLPQKKQKSRRKQRKEIEVPSPSSEIPNDEWLPTTSNDPLPSGEDRMQLNELMILCTNLQKYVLDLEEAKTAQAKEIACLKKRVKKLEQKRKSRTLRLKRLRKGRMIDNIDQDVEITLVDDTYGRINKEDMFGVNDLDGDEVVVDVSAITTDGIKVTTAATTLQIIKDELTLAQTLIEIKAAKSKAITTVATTVTVTGTRPKEKGIVMQEPSKTPSPKLIISSQKPSQAKEKGKGKMVEPERPLKRKYQIIIDVEVAKNLEAQMQAELEEEERLARLKEEETKIALKAQEGSSKRAGDKLKQEDAKRKRIEEENETTELKRCLEIIPENSDDVTIEAIPLSSKSLTIVDYKIYKDGRKSFSKIIKADGSKKAQEGSSKRAGDKLKQEDAKRKRIEEENETTELKRCLEIIPENSDDVTIEAIPLSSKSLTIVDYKIYKDGRKSFSKIIKADGNSQNYLTIEKMFKNFSREDLEVLWSIFKARFKKTKPIDDMDNLLQVDYVVEMAYDLLRLIRKQINEGYVPE